MEKWKTIDERFRKLAGSRRGLEDEITVCCEGCADNRLLIRSVHRQSDP